MQEFSEPKYFKVLEKKQLRGNHGKGLVAFKLQYDAKKFDGAGCRGINTELFYPDKNVFTREEERLFQNMCIDCPAMLACLEWALVHEREGVWAGTTPAQRHAIRRRLGLQVNDPARTL